MAAMLPFLRLLIVACFRSRAAVAAENLALRHQIGVLARTARRPRLRRRDRVFWVWLSRIWPDWRSALVIVKPELLPADFNRSRPPLSCAPGCVNRRRLVVSADS